ncbi:sugar phosphate isomerase/epimerase [Paenibacillus dokdonensis]|uniref:Sugar phosphate isomerase/epimerase n=1 Tax=Paenibacillus dokdonensis TaxID=2567944 RepID=A0ABU6GWA5_9BACL|nr:sugar phosphate isomerase/epimerase [Paenibacillus dokdonensis]MEC0242452.1 sugar phosphate isomerase/epimerase [Paenibacillus dokdonensis]
MITPGIFSKTFGRPSLEQTLDAVKSYGLDIVQFNLVCAGLTSMPEHIDLEAACRIRLACRERGISIAAVSGTFNMIHPDVRVRQEGLKRLGYLAAMSHEMGTSTVTLCSGTRNSKDMWKAHPDNDSDEAWRDLIRSMKEALIIAEDYDIVLAFEPEKSNVIDCAAKGKRLIDTLETPRLKVVMDGANLFGSGESDRMKEVLEEAFDLLGEHIVIAHAKDFAEGEEVEFLAAGTGSLNYDMYLSLLRKHSFDGPLILHGLHETQVARSLQFIRKKIQCD